MGSMFSRVGWAGVLGVLGWGASMAGCLEDRPPAEAASDSEGDRTALGVRLLAALEGSGGADAAGAPDPAEAAEVAGSWDDCAETANTCLETSGDPVGCIRGYVVCAVGTGLEADHPYLVCVEGLATCWEASEELTLAEACALEYDDCVEAYLASVPAEPPYPTEPSDPTEPAGPSDPADPFAGCIDEVNACFEARPDDELGCVTGYRDCLVGVGADAPYIGCLDSVIACLGAGGHSDACYEVFDHCVASAYPPDPGTDPGAEHGTGPDEYEWAVCEEPTVHCYELGGTNVDCLTVYRSCLIDYGLETDDPRIGCLDTLIECVAPAEASADPDAALEVCALDFNACLAEPIE